MAKTGNIIRKKSTKTYVFSYALIAGFWAVVQIMGHMGLLSSKMLGLLIPICAYAIMAVSLNLVRQVLSFIMAQVSICLRFRV